MSDRLKLIANEGNPAVQGIILSSLIIIAGIFPHIKITDIEIYVPIDSWLLISLGIGLLFYFISIKVNQQSKVDEKGEEWIFTPVRKSPLSKECEKISLIFFLLFLLRIGQLVISRILSIPF